MKIPIEINGHPYYYENIFGGEYSEYCYTQFYEKGENIKKRKIKRKFWLFGPVISDEIIEKENYIPVFRSNREIAEGKYFDISDIKIREMKYHLWKTTTWPKIKEGKLSL